jgi:hypothetical protein
MSNDCIKCNGFGLTGWLWWQKACGHCNGTGYEPAPKGKRPLPPPPPPPSCIDRHPLFPQYSRGTVDILIQQRVITIGDIENAAIVWRRKNKLPA